MRVATWNINGIRARLDYVLHWLRSREPDLVGLQELKVDDDQFPAEQLEQAGYHIALHGQPAWNGVAILSRSSARVTQIGLPGQEALGARLITAQIDDLSFTTVYCPNGKDVEHADFPAKLAWLDALCGHLEQTLDRSGQAILCGDLNICATALDTWNEGLFHGRIFHTDDERTRFRRLVDCGLLDLFRECRPEERLFSWWDYRGGAFHRGQGLRIDYLLGTPAVLQRVRSVHIDRDYRKKKEGWIASDHAPVYADLE